MTTLRVPGDEQLTPGPGAVDPASRTGGIEDAPTLALAHEVRVDTGRAEPLVVGGGDHVAGANEIADVREERCDVGVLRRRADVGVARRAVRPRRRRADRPPASCPSARRPRPTPRCRDRRQPWSGTGRATRWPRRARRCARRGSASPASPSGAGRAPRRSWSGHPAPRLRTRAAAIAPVSAMQVASDATETDLCPSAVMLPLRRRSPAPTRARARRRRRRPGGTSSRHAPSPAGRRDPVRCARAG